MAKITAWKCDHTGKLFDDVAKYRKHLRKISKKIKLINNVAVIKSSDFDFYDQMGQVSSIDELTDFIKQNWKLFYYNGLDREYNITKSITRDVRRAAEQQMHQLIDLEFFNIRYLSSVSNTHSAPKSGVTNWRSDPSLPSGYPGWVGQLKFTIQSNDRVYGSRYFDRTPITLGSGGGGGGKQPDHFEYTFSVTLWEDDFPVMSELRKKYRVAANLGLAANKTKAEYR